MHLVLDQKCSYVKPYGAGHINETYAVYMPGKRR